jgi:hypothetical protein
MLQKYKNGNATITIENDGSRVVEYENTLQLEFPLNIDIRVSTKCAFGAKDDGTLGFCSFCHESAKQNGSECDYKLLREKLWLLPRGIELAIGANQITENLYWFLSWATREGFICNLTINQGHLRRDLEWIKRLIKANTIKGLGISYRGNLKWDIPKEILEYSNTVFHVIAGIDTFSEVESLINGGVKKILILGEKDFGYNKGNVDLQSRNHKEWYWWVHKLFMKFDVVSFDNLALEQLNIKRFFTYKNWDVFNNGEHSMYINAVDGYFAPSSRSDKKTNWDSISIEKYFQENEKKLVTL